MKMDCNKLILEMKKINFKIKKALFKIRRRHFKTQEFSIFKAFTSFSELWSLAWFTLIGKLKTIWCNEEFLTPVLCKFLKTTNALYASIRRTTQCLDALTNSAPLALKTGRPLIVNVPFAEFHMEMKCRAKQKRLLISSCKFSQRRRKLS